MKAHLLAYSTLFLIGNHAISCCTNDTYPTPETTTSPKSTTSPKTTTSIGTTTSTQATTTTCAKDYTYSTGVLNRCPTGWELLEKNCYKVFPESNEQSKRYTFAEASDLCDSVRYSAWSASFGFSAKGQLATVTSPAINDLLLHLAKNRLSKEMWIGLKSAEITDFPKWMDGTFVNYTKWVAYKPANIWHTQTCVRVLTNSHSPENRTQDGYWEVFPCNNHAPSYACQMVRIGGPVCKTDIPSVSSECTFQSGPKPCPTGWTLFKAAGTCYKKITLENSNYHDFTKACNKLGASLPSIHNDVQYEFIRKQIGGNDTFWMGLKSSGKKNDNFDRFEDGTTLNYGKWRYVKVDVNGPAEQQCAAANVVPGEDPVKGWILADCHSKTTAAVTMSAKRARGTFSPNGCESLISPNPRR